MSDIGFQFFRFKDCFESLVRISVSAFILWHLSISYSVHPLFVDAGKIRANIHVIGGFRNKPEQAL
jgi:hypothetical protein